MTDRAAVLPKNTGSMITDQSGQPSCLHTHQADRPTH